jgi:predicted transcriptional regulator
VARTSWFDDKAEHPVIQERIEKLESFTNALADGVVSSEELQAQERRVTSVMKALEGSLSDEAHAQVTTVLVELSAYNVMRVLHELQSQHARRAFGSA